MPRLGSSCPRLGTAAGASSQALGPHPSTFLTLMRSQPASLHLVHYLLPLRRHRRDRRTRDFHRAVASLANDQIEGRVVRVLVGMVVAEVSAAALAPLERRARDRLRDGQQIV